jgi:hypothetical protein
LFTTIDDLCRELATYFDGVPPPAASDSPNADASASESQS